MKLSKGKIAAIVIVGLIVINAAGSIKPANKVKNVYSGHSGSYTAIDYLDGATFDMPTSMLSSVQSIQKFSENDDTYMTGAWLLKQNNDTYVLFQNNFFYVIAAKGTTFDIDKKDPWAALSKAAITNVGEDWFYRDGKNKCRSASRNGVTKYVYPVLGDVTLNSTVYGRYIGKLGVMTKGDAQYAIFAGYAGTEYDKVPAKLRDIINHIVESLAYTGKMSTDVSGTTDLPATDTTIATGDAIEPNEIEQGTIIHND